MLLLVFSAILYALPFLYPDVWYLIFIFLIPIFYLADKKQLSFSNGFMWGLIAFSLQEFGIFYSFLVMSDFNLIVYLIEILFLLYQCIFSGFWFFLTNKLSYFINNSIALVIITWIYFLFLEHYLLIFFYKAEGYPFASPILVLANYTPLLFLLKFITEPIFLLLFICFNAILFNFFTLKHINQLLFVIFLCCFLYISHKKNIYKDNHDLKTNLSSKIMHLPYAFDGTIDPKNAILKMQNKIKQILANNDNIDLFIAPESSLFLCDLNNLNHLVEFFGERYLSKKINILIGAIRSEGINTYNTVYWIYDGKIIDYYDKKHALILTEQLPSWANIDSIKNLYLKNRSFISTSKQNGIMFDIKISDYNFKIYPTICSEIFFYNANPIEKYDSKTIIISFCNDSWISMDYLNKLMLLMHKYRQAAWDVPIIYCAYNKCELID